MKLDTWDLVGGGGVLLVAAGIAQLLGPAAAEIFVGALLMALYIAREVRQ